MTCTVTPHPRSYHDAFILTLNEAQSFNFKLAGIQTSSTETLVRFGILPDNHLLSNKLIHIFGSRALALLKAQPLSQARAEDTLWCQTVADEAELFATWHLIDILSALKPLEKLTGSHTQENSVTILEEVRGKIQGKLTVAHPYVITHNNNSDDHLIQALNSRHQALLKECEILLAGNTWSPLQQRHLYQTLVNRFEEQQTLIGTHQRELFTLFDVANATNTNTTQKAANAIQEHAFPAKTCTDEQLWIKNPSLGGKVSLDTTDYPSLRTEDALFAAALLQAQNSVPEITPSPEKILEKAHQQRDTDHQKIKDEHTKLKNQIDTARLEHASWRHPLNFLQAYLKLYRDSAVAEAFAGEKLAGDTGWVWMHRLSQWFQADRTALHTKLRDILTSQNAATLASPPAAFARELPVHQYVPSDLFSALMSLSYELSQYFSRELAAKHPVVTTASFMVPCAYFTTIALQGLHIAPHAMHTICNALSKALSADGHLLNPEKITLTCAEIEKVWLHVTGAKGMVDTLILSSFGAPKVSFFIGDELTKILTGTQENVLTELSRQLNNGRLDVNNLSDDVREKVKHLVRDITLLTAAILLGLSAPALASVPALKGLASLIGFFDRINANSFSDLLNERGAAQAAAGAEVLMEFKVASLFLAKLMVIGYFAQKKQYPEGQHALVYFLSHQAKNTAPEIIRQDSHFNRHRLPLEKLLAQEPALKQILGIDFLKSLDIRDYHPAPAVLLALYALLEKLVGTVSTIVVGLLALLPTLFYLAFTASTTVPDSAALRYMLKQSTKLLYLMERTVAALFYGIKFIAQALGGCALRVVVAALAVLFTIPIVIINFFERLIRKGPLDAFSYLGAKLVKSLYMPVHVLESVGYAISMILLPLTLGVIALVAAFTKDEKKTFSEKFYELFKHFRQNHHQLSAACRAVDINFTKKSADPKYSQIAQDYTYRLLATISILGIQFKNLLGEPIAWLRDQTLRRLSYRLQVIEHKSISSRHAGIFATAPEITVTPASDESSSEELPEGTKNAENGENSTPVMAPT